GRCRRNFSQENSGRRPRNRSSTEPLLRPFRKIVRTNGRVFCQQCAQTVVSTSVPADPAPGQVPSLYSQWGHLKPAWIACAGSGGSAVGARRDESTELVWRRSWQNLTQRTQSDTKDTEKISRWPF